MLNGKNIRAKHRCKKLEYMMLGSFEVLSVGTNLQYCRLKLPDSWMIHSIFNIELLEKYKRTHPNKQVLEIEANGNDWVVESIIASGPSDDNITHHVYLVKWKDFLRKENAWETYNNVAESDLRLLEEYYKKNPMVERDGRFIAGKRKRDGRRKTKKNKGNTTIKYGRLVLNLICVCIFVMLMTKHH
jgi:hypothetical protein